MSALLTQRPVTSVLDLVTTQFAAADPAACAVSCGGSELSWRELDEWAWAIAERLRAAGIGWGDVVPVLAARGGGLVAGWLAVLRTGAAYTPLSLDTPVHRLAHIVAEVGATTMLVDRLGAELVEGLSSDAVLIRVDQLGTVPGRAPAEPVALTGREPAVVIYTSGTSGRPKGVLVTHCGLLNTALWWADDIGLSPADRLVCTWSTSFDGATFEVFRSLLAGSQLVFADDTERRDPRALRRLLRGPRGATVTSMTPSLLKAVLAADEDGATTLRALYVGGEALPRWLARECHQRWRVQARNIYGPTEAACISTYAPVDPADKRPPAIGVPLPNTRAYVLGPNQEELPIGVPGELYVAGAGVALGYLGQPERTAAAFVPDHYPEQPDDRMYRTGDRVVLRADGLLEYLGRVDDQVKILGHRIEPDEVRKLLEEQPAIRAAAVHAVGEPRQLHAYVELIDGRVVAAGTQDSLPTRDEVLRPLLRWLPPAVLPAEVFVVDALPLTGNDKVDFAALGAMQSRRLPQVSRVRAELSGNQVPAAELFALALNEADRGQRAVVSTELGPESNFFTMGGHSLLAVRLVAEAQRRGLGQVALRDFLADPTVAGLGRLLSAPPTETLPTETLPTETLPTETRLAGTQLAEVHGTDRFPATSVQQRLWFLDHVPELRSAYLVPAVVELTGAVDRSVLVRAVDSVLARHPALRSRFELDRAARQVCYRTDGPPAGSTQVDASSWETAELGEYVSAVCWSPFDLACEAPARAQIIASGDRTLLVLSVHHIVIDAWSHQLLMDQIAETYQAETQHRPADLPDSVHPAALGTTSGNPDTSRTEALSRLRGAPTDVWLPHDHARGDEVQATIAGTAATALGPALTARLRAVLGELNATTFMATAVFLAATLAQRSAQRDFLFAFPWAGREAPSSAHAVGMFVNTLVLRVDLTGAPTWRELLLRVREASISSYGNADLPLDVLAAVLHPDRNLSRPPLTPVYLSAQRGAPIPPQLGPEVMARYLPLEPLHIKYEFELTATDYAEDLEFIASYALGLFEAETITELLAALVANATDLVSNLDSPALKAPKESALKESVQSEGISR